jgi:ribosomal protein L11 methylase PrmA
VWECTSDLLNYLATSNLKKEMEGKTVLDLGCGAGVLGIFALMNGAQRVDFQDYVSNLHNSNSSLDAQSHTS